MQNTPAGITRGANPKKKVLQKRWQLANPGKVKKVTREGGEKGEKRKKHEMKPKKKSKHHGDWTQVGGWQNGQLSGMRNQYQRGPLTKRKGDVWIGKLKKLTATGKAKLWPRKKKLENTTSRVFQKR